MDISFKTALTPEDKARWIQFWMASRHAHPEQHPWYGALEYAAGRRPLYAIGEEAGQIRGVALLSLRPLWRDWRCSMDVICRRGPVFDEPWAGRDLLLGIIQRITALRVGSIRISSDWIYPGAVRTEMMMREVGFEPVDSEPRTATGRIDLTRDPEALLASFSSSTRRDIRLVERRGIDVRPVRTAAELKAAYACMMSNQRKTGLTRVSFGQFETFYRALTQSGSLGALFGAFHDGKLIGEIAVAASPGVAYPKMYSVDATKARQLSNFSVGPSLWWQCFLWARERGCDWFDVEGSVSRLDPSHAHFEISNFKRRFSPEPVERLSEFILVCDPKLHRMHHTVNQAMTAWKRSIKWMYSPARRRRGHSDVRELAPRPPPMPAPA